MLKSYFYIDSVGGKYISREFLRQMGTSGKTISSWHERGNVIWIEIEGEFYYLYKSLSKRIKRSLGNITQLKVIEQKLIKAAELKRISENIKAAYYFGFNEYTGYYHTGGSIPSERAVQFARLHSVLNCTLIEKREGFRDLKGLYDLFNSYFPGKYKSKHAFSNALRTAAADGIETVALDKRVFGNNNDKTSTRISAVTKFWAVGIISHPRKLSNSKVLELLTKECTENGYNAPSLSWVKKYRQRILGNPELYMSRYGSQQSSKKMPYVSTSHAAYSMQQVQMDGWTLPFWYEDGKPFRRMVLVYLIDSCSKMIIGYTVGPSENTQLIVDALRDAINTTGQLPFEIVTDNHAFQKTIEAKNVHLAFEKKGSRFTVTQNPQHKAIIERYNQLLDTHCKDFAGYLGQGIRSKSLDALPSSETFEKYAKFQLQAEEVKAIAISVVEKYNSTISKKTGLTTKQLFEKMQNPHKIEATIFDRANLLTLQTDKLVRRGQITFEKGGRKHEFQLDANQYLVYNDKTVIVKYEDLNDCIYIYDKATGEPIDCLHPKSKIHGAIVNQTDEDVTKLHKNAGRIKGIKAKARTQVEAIRDAALNQDPDAYLKLNQMVAPKDVIQEMRESGTLAQITLDRGIDIEQVAVSVKPQLHGTSALYPEKKNTNPFSSKGHKIEILKNDDQNDDE